MANLLLFSESVIGLQFSNLTVIKDLGVINRHRRVLVRCVCGNEKETSLRHLKGNSIIKSCGCKSGSETHGLSHHPLYSVWCGMKRRCYNTHDNHYKDYGGRGIAVCDEWKNNFLTFYEWAIPTYQKGLFLDRVNFNGNYEPNNCRFITVKESSLNTSQNVFIEHEGKRLTMSQWGELKGIPMWKIWQRIKRDGMSIERALMPQRTPRKQSA